MNYQDRRSHCGFCGTRFQEDLLAAGRFPRACVNTQCNRTTYNNPHMVVVVLIPVETIEGSVGVITIKRAIEPEKGQLALPGGYVTGPAMRGTLPAHSVQSQGVEEVYEETGITLNLHTLLDLLTVGPTENGAILHFMEAPLQIESELPPFLENKETSARFITLEPVNLAFATHTAMLEWYLLQKIRGLKGNAWETSEVMRRYRYRTD
jgi:ADP-ribose pyrophosphatase YjhB (NUDIX family)